jgi:hypothetical protein
VSLWIIVIVVHFIGLLTNKITLVRSQSTRKLAWLQLFHDSITFVVIAIEHLSLLHLILKITLAFLLLPIYWGSWGFSLLRAHQILILLIHAIFVFIENSWRILGSIIRCSQSASLNLTLGVKDDSVLVHHLFHFLGVWLLLRLKLWWPIVFEAFLLENLSYRKIFSLLARGYFSRLGAIWLVRVALRSSLFHWLIVTKLTHLLPWNLILCNQGMRLFSKTICAPRVGHNLGALHRILWSPYIRVVV